MNITKGKLPGAKKVVIYGPEGIGKSTFASKFPDPVFIDTEGSTKDMDVARFDKPASWQMLLDEVKYVQQHPECCKTLVVDTADWAEMLCSESICNKAQMDGIEGFGYGKGYVYLAEEFGRLLDLLSDVVEKGIHVVVTAHAMMRKFEQPDEMGAYDRWELKLQKKTAPLLKEWADMLLFANYKTYSVAVDTKGQKRKAQGGRRVMYTQHHPCWDAKNRYGLPEQISFDYSEIAPIIEGVSIHKEPEAVSAPQIHPSTQQKEKEPVKENEQMSLPINQPEERKTDDFPKQDPRIPKALKDLMEANHVDEWDIQNVVEARGYVPAGTPIWEYDNVNPGIVDGLLVASWDQVYAAIKEMKKTQEVPFNK